MSQMPIMGTPGETRLALFPEDATADKMDVQEVVRYIMDAFRPEEDEDDGWQFSNTFEEAAGSSFKGSRVLHSFSAKAEQRLDALGQLQPGAFERPTLLEEYLLREDNYRTLALLSEWKAVAAPEQLGDRSVRQRLLVRRERGNWEEAQVRLELRDVPQGTRWMVASLCKRDHDPVNAQASAAREDDGGDPEETRNC